MPEKASETVPLPVKTRAVLLLGTGANGRYEFHSRGSDPLMIDRQNVATSKKLVYIPGNALVLTGFLLKPANRSSLSPTFTPDDGSCLPASDRAVRPFLARLETISQVLCPITVGCFTWTALDLFSFW